MRDLKVSLNWLVSMANSPEREQCPDTIHETAIHNTERAIEAERKLEELLDELQKTEQSLQNAWVAFVEKEKEVENLKSLARELIEALEIAEGAMYADIMTAHDYPSCEVKVKSVLAKAKEVLGDE